MALAAQPYGPIAPGPGLHAVAITPSDTLVHSPPLRSIWIGTTGAVAIVAVGDSLPVTLPAVPVGLLQLPCLAQVIMATGTTASGIIGFF